VFGTNLHHLQAIALALHHSGVDWEGEFPSAWKEMKSKTPFGELPVLEAPADVEATHGRPKFGRFGVGSIWCEKLYQKAHLRIQVSKILGLQSGRSW